MQLLFGPRVEAQASFAWPDTVVNVSAYSSVDECVSAVLHSHKRYEAAQAWLDDTMPWDPQQNLRPLPSWSASLAKQCAARYDASTAPLRDFAPLMTLYLQAGRDADAATVLERRISEVSAAHGTERTAVEDSAVVIYLGAHPPRLAAAESLLIQRAGHKTDRVSRLELYAKLTDQARQLGDTARSERWAGRMVALADSLSAEDRNSREYLSWYNDRGGRMSLFFAAFEAAGRQSRLASLRQSTDVYLQSIRSLWTKMTGERGRALSLPIGEQASPIAARFWYPADSAAHPHPAPGRVSVIAFLDANRRPQMPELVNQCLAGAVILSPNDLALDYCWEEIAFLRRLAAKFPTLDITVVGRTHGNGMYGPPPSPQDEATLIERWWRGHGAPGILAIDSTAFWRLDAPDNRRVDRPDSNIVHYTFGKSWPVGMGSVFLIDQSGVIVYASNARQGPQEADMADLIRVLQERSASEASHAAR